VQGRALGVQRPGAGATTGTGGSLPGGTVEWAATVTSTSYAVVSSLSLSATGVMGGGLFQGVATFTGAGTLDAQGSPWHGFAFRLAAAGTTENLFQIKAGMTAMAAAVGVTALAAAPDGNTLVAGQFGESVLFNGQPQPSAGSLDAFVAKLDGAGNPLWFDTWGGPSDDSAQALAIFPGGDVAIVGLFSGTAMFGGCKSATDRSIFVSRA
jgi:hypothetical protein